MVTVKPCLTRHSMVRLSLSLHMHRHPYIGSHRVGSTSSPVQRTHGERGPGPVRSEDQPVTAEPNDDKRARALAEVGRDYPGWRAWPGVLAGVVYARRPRAVVRPWWSAPPVRATY